MADNIVYKSAYAGTKNFTQHNVKSANATGFGAAADDFMERGIDLNEQLILNKSATFFFRMNSEAMTNAGIYVGDVLIVDRSIKPTNGKIIVAAVNGDLFVRYFDQNFNKTILSAANKKFGDIVLDEFTQFMCWGIVTCNIHMLHPMLAGFNKKSML